MSKEKIDSTNSIDARDRATKALEKMKALEQKFKDSLISKKLPNGVEIKSTNIERINEFIENYG